MYSAQLKINGQFNVFLVSVKPFVTAPGSLKRRDGACVNWFNWRTFWTFVLHCDVTKNKNSTIFKLKSWVLNVSYSWWVKCYVIKVLVVECNLSIDRRITYFDTYVYMNFSDVKNCWCLCTYFRYTLYTISFPACYDYMQASVEPTSVTSAYRVCVRIKTNFAAPYYRPLPHVFSSYANTTHRTTLNCIPCVNRAHYHDPPFFTSLQLDSDHDSSCWTLEIFEFLFLTYWLMLRK